MMSRCLVVLLVLLGYTSALTCPSGYFSQGNYCYKLFSSPKTRDQAALTCQIDGAVLPTILDQTTNDYIFNFARQVGSVFIGLTCVNNQLPTCRFEDLTRLFAGSYQSFYGDLPFTKYGNCVWMEEGGHYPGEWASVDCANTTSSFVCQYTDSYNCGTAVTAPSTTAVAPIIANWTWPGFCNSAETLIASYNQPVEIFSANWPNHYPQDYSCLWHVHTKSGSGAYINITSVDLASGTGVHIYADNDPAGTPVMTLTSNSRAPIVLTTLDYNPTIIFYTADGGSSSGFRALVIDPSSSVSMAVEKEKKGKKESVMRRERIN